MYSIKQIPITNIGKFIKLIYIYNKNRYILLVLIFCMYVLCTVVQVFATGHTNTSQSEEKKRQKPLKKCEIVREKNILLQSKEAFREKLNCLWCELQEKYTFWNQHQQVLSRVSREQQYLFEEDTEEHFQQLQRVREGYLLTQQELNITEEKLEENIEKALLWEAQQTEKKKQQTKEIIKVIRKKKTKSQVQSSLQEIKHIQEMSSQTVEKLQRLKELLQQQHIIVQESRTKEQEALKEWQTVEQRKELLVKEQKATSQKDESLNHYIELVTQEAETMRKVWEVSEKKKLCCFQALQKTQRAYFSLGLKAKKMKEEWDKMFVESTEEPVRQQAQQRCLQEVQTHAVGHSLQPEEEPQERKGQKRSYSQMVEQQPEEMEQERSGVAEETEGLQDILVQLEQEILQKNVEEQIVKERESSEEAKENARHAKQYAQQVGLLIQQLKETMQQVEGSVRHTQASQHILVASMQSIKTHDVYRKARDSAKCKKLNVQKLEQILAQQQQQQATLATASISTSALAPTIVIEPQTEPLDLCQKRQRTTLDSSYQTTQTMDLELQTEPLDLSQTGHPIPVQHTPSASSQSVSAAFLEPQGDPLDVTHTEQQPIIVQDISGYCLLSLGAEEEIGSEESELMELSFDSSESSSSSRSSTPCPPLESSEEEDADERELQGYHVQMDCSPSTPPGSSEMSMFLSDVHPEAQYTSLASLQSMYIGTTEQVSQTLKWLRIKNRSTNHTPRNAQTEGHLYSKDTQRFLPTYAHRSLVSGTVERIQSTLASLISASQFFVFVDDKVTDLEQKVSSAQVGVITTPITNIAVGVAYGRSTSPRRIDCTQPIHIAHGSAATHRHTNNLSAMVAWNTHEQGFTAHITSCYGWGKARNTRFFAYKGHEISTQGYPKSALGGGLLHVGYNIPLTGRMFITPYIEGIYAIAQHNAYKEISGPTSCQIGKNKENHWERSLGIMSRWDSKKHAQLHLWGALTSGQRTTYGLTSRPLHSSYFLSTVALPTNKKHYSKREIGMSYECTITENITCSFHSTLNFYSNTSNIDQYKNVYININVKY